MSSEESDTNNKSKTMSSDQGLYPATERARREAKQERQRRYSRERSLAVSLSRAARAAVATQNATRDIILSNNSTIVSNNNSNNETICSNTNQALGLFGGLMQFAFGNQQGGPMFSPVARPSSQPTTHSSSNRLESCDDEEENEVQVFRPPPKEVELLEIDDDGEVKVTACVLTPGENHGDYDITPVKSESVDKEDPKELKRRIRVLEGEKKVLEADKSRLAKNNMGLLTENMSYQQQIQRLEQEKAALLYAQAVNVGCTGVRGDENPRPLKRRLQD